MCFGVWKKFKEFVHDKGGNVVDLGIGIIVGGAFTNVVTSFVMDILTPPLGLVLHGSNLENFFIVIRPGNTPNATYNTVAEAQADGAVTENVGMFISTIINFFLICITLFWIFYVYHSIQESRKRENKESTEECQWCQSELPKGAIKCKFCTSLLAEKIPPEYKRNEMNADSSGSGGANDADNERSALIDLQ
ncbi:2471_t:CDS:2 [Entrophospora sp. SA101]|nr:2471_t:CDS:2 [Entrophospora sp. SA101]CAJ0831304.1 12752_t:CDS:2 [Entrophospora sp. SA101]CAJ0832647.1 1484_t:CDS:2 [Entrophospora sp. SA101]